MKKMEDNLMTVDELADYLRFQKSMIYNYIKSGYLPVYRIAGQWRFRRSDIEEWLEQQKYYADAAAKK